MYTSLNLDDRNQQELQKIVIGLANAGGKITILDTNYKLAVLLGVTSNTML